MYRSNQIDGIILLQVRMDDWRVNLLRENNYPFVMIGRCADLEGLSFIDLDFEDAMLHAFDYLGRVRSPKHWFSELSQNPGAKPELDPQFTLSTDIRHALKQYGLRAAIERLG